MSNIRKLIEQMREFFADMRRDVLEAVEGMFDERCTWDPEECCLEPLTNIIETEKEILIMADLPYVKKDNISLSVSEDMLDLEASLDQSLKFAQWGTIQRNTEFCKFHTHIKLPPNVDSNDIEATFKNGFLQIKLPKRLKRLKIKIE